MLPYMTASRTGWRRSIHPAKAASSALSMILSGSLSLRPRMKDRGGGPSTQGFLNSSASRSGIDSLAGGGEDECAGVANAEKVGVSRVKGSGRVIRPNWVKRRC